MNKLYYGDNLAILRDFIPANSIDLTYLDPPFNSNRNYNVLFREESGRESEAQITAFEDTWHWNEATARTYDEIVTGAPDEVATMIAAMKTFVGANQMMAYLVMMTVRLIELNRVLKPTGSVYLHCDATASHYLKVILVTIFGADNYRDEITWKRQSAHNDARRKFATIIDTIFYYVKSSKAVFNPIRVPLDSDYVLKAYRHADGQGRKYRLSDLRSPNPRPNLTYEYKGYKPHPNGWAVSRAKMETLDAEGRLYFPKSQDGRIQLKRYLDENEGAILGNLWDDILPLHGSTAELLGYPTQKPVERLKRILEASSSEGDVVLDAFCGCGTSIAAAQELNRQWIGIDITHLAIALQKYRLRDAFKLVEKKDYLVIGEPTDLEGAKQLAEEDRYQFQWWALSLVQAIPTGSSFGSRTGKKGADRGIDGVINFTELGKDKLQKVLIQVKSGKVKSGDVRDLRGTIEREKAAIGVFITLDKPSPQMITESAEAGFYQSFAGASKYPKIQIITVEQLLHGAEIKMPPRLHQNFKPARRVSIKDKQVQPNLYEI